jgi:protein SERAC1
MYRICWHRVISRCFYEALKTNDAVSKIVESKSVKLAAYDNYSMNIDHRNMTKSTGRTEAGYGQVRDILNRWVQEYKSHPPNASAPEAALEGNTTNDSSREGASYNGPVFNCPISGHYVIPGVHTAGGTVNFNFCKGSWNDRE